MQGYGCSSSIVRTSLEAKGWEQYTQLRGFVHDLLDDLRALPYQKFIGIGFLLIGILIGHHCIDGEAVMLTADAEGLVGLAQIL